MKQPVHRTRRPAWSGHRHGGCPRSPSRRHGPEALETRVLLTASEFGWEFEAVYASEVAFEVLESPSMDDAWAFDGSSGVEGTSSPMAIGDDDWIATLTQNPVERYAVSDTFDVMIEWSVAEAATLGGETPNAHELAFETYRLDPEADLTISAENFFFASPIFSRWERDGLGINSSSDQEFLDLSDDPGLAPAFGTFAAPGDPQGDFVDSGLVVELPSTGRTETSGTIGSTNIESPNRLEVDAAGRERAALNALSVPAMRVDDHGSRTNPITQVEPTSVSRLSDAQPKQPRATGQRMESSSGGYTLEPLAERNGSPADEASHRAVESAVGPLPVGHDAFAREVDKVLRQLSRPREQAVDGIPHPGVAESPTGDRATPNASGQGMVLLVAGSPAESSELWPCSEAEAVLGGLADVSVEFESTLGAYHSFDVGRAASVLETLRRPADQGIASLQETVRELASEANRSGVGKAFGYGIVLITTATAARAGLRCPAKQPVTLTPRRLVREESASEESDKSA